MFLVRSDCISLAPNKQLNKLFKIQISFQLLKQMNEMSNGSMMAEKPHQYAENGSQEENNGGEKLKGTFVQKTVSINESKTVV